jgi:hypothetical protein
MKQHVNTVGATYVAINFLGWAAARSPWAAMAKLELSLDGKRVTVGSDAYEKLTKEVSLFYIPDEEKFTGIQEYHPVDADGNPYGVPLYAGTQERNEKVILNTLNK